MAAEILDKVFKAYDVRGIYGKEVTEDLAWRIGHAAAQYMRSKLSGYDRGMSSSNRLVVGYDMRPSSESLMTALINGVTASGIDCIDIGMCDTPMVYFAINHLGSCGGVMITASHNPPEYNGFKISAAKAKPVGKESGLDEIKHMVSMLTRMPEGASVASSAQCVDLWGDYRKHVLRFLRTPRRLKIVVDGSNSMGGKCIPRIFSDSDIEIVPLNWTIGKGFAHEPNPLIESNLAQVKKTVVANKADMGICLDGDADRCMFIDEKGQAVRSDLITALVGRHFLRDHPGSTIVYDLRSSRAVAEEVRTAGGVARRERVGHAFMKKALADTHAIFGGELSGHYYFRDNWNCDSGVIAFATVASMLAAQDKPLSRIVEPLQRYSQSGEINFRAEDKAAKMDEVTARYKDAEIDSLDGVTIQYDDWWCNVRASNTEPLLRLNLEAKTPELMKQKLAEVESMLGKPIKE
ncbi:MAG: phosphomannomutase/phosphoglucomutase [Planctomycetaceae bacterium]|nr:phosphomannomutase/phosphoglucomutase [Planctomycetaceae bacterium]